MSQHRPVGTPGRAGAVPALPDLPEATVARLPEYLRALHNLAETGNDTVSSEELAAAAGVNSAKLRKDLSQLGSYGTRGVGYDVALLIDQIEFVLGLTQRRAVALVGVGNLGHALAGYAGFVSRGFRIAALFDADPARVGEEINGLVVQHIDELPRVAAEERIAIGVIATPATAAQSVADQLVAAGVTSILNFAPCVLAVPDGVDVRKVDLAIELQILSFHEHRKAALTGLPPTSGPGLPPAAGGGLASPLGGSVGAGLTGLPGGLAATGTTEPAPTGSFRSTNAEAVGS
ncbi:redox-sensing transcriptional repressor Rex [Plantactinospora sp. S1510]|uniref:Redox-sensing transcriptional repressor Rex n=1 Tax=Plantactinospora alkalitolerans TaxID=2789879 RepID=A0ABS0H9A9_9ACTN|nr:redox-sensing transcriptional repressor Rex [Plantactinospora alkalitolerans]MBF9134667.1 redox-sensing transcriptional repressor Rex [Plantactinospora alkalitolerans]